MERHANSKSQDEESILCRVSLGFLRFIMAFVVFCLSLESVSDLALENLRRHFPNKNAAFYTRRHEELLVGRNCNLGDATGVTDTLEVDNTLVVVPQLDDLVFTTADEVLSLIGNSERVQLS